MQLTNNARAFIGAAVLVVVFSVALVQFGIIGGDESDSGNLAGGQTSVTPAVLESTMTPVANSATATVAPSTAPSAGPPITAPIEVPILMYHQVLPELPADEFDAVLTVTTAALEEQISYLTCAGYTPVTMARLFAAFEGREALPEKPVILTFDDGWSDHYTYLFPILQAHGVTASLAIVSGFVEAGGPYVTWAQIKLMSDAGIEMMSHSVSHVDLGTSDDATVLDQITTSKADIEAHTGKTVDFLVYPSGEPFRSGSVERQRQVVQMLSDAGYRGALLAGPNSLTQDPSTPFALNRVRVSGGEDLYTFAGSIFGPDPDSLSCP